MQHDSAMLVLCFKRSPAIKPHALDNSASQSVEMSDGAGLEGMLI